MSQPIVGVCSWSLQVGSVAELKRLLDDLGVEATQIACGDPHHASWEEGDAMPAAALASGLHMTGAMLGFPGEDYTTPQTIKATGGFGDPATRAERLDRLAWALERTVALGLTDLMLHAGFLPEVGDPGRAAHARHAGEGRSARGRQGNHAGVRDRPGDGRPAPADARRPEGAEPQGQLRPGQHAPVRHGRPDPRRGDPRAGHPQRPRQGRPPARRCPAPGARKSRSARARSTFPCSCKTLKKVGYRGLSWSSARSATRARECVTSGTDLT